MKLTHGENTELHMLKKIEVADVENTKLVNVEEHRTSKC